MEGAFGHTREDSNHRICPILLVQAWVSYYVCSILQECPSKEHVHKKYITNLCKNHFH